jgi:hypothetical protein
MFLFRLFIFSFDALVYYAKAYVTRTLILWGSFASCSADFIGALRGALLSRKRPVGNRPAGYNPAPQAREEIKIL